ncbi:T9SS type A sorting domain-containing protein [Spirosoma agri]|uniref:T9SS type A sorting domain-containing protein n=1 Tax=Spirosoma agri TaxID=1987381 RepID=A0A6M0ILG0_9BACT|nr:T9SS type A sorting domain-containing protein [Spirosoma agri]NEU69118.1 T9SS type A sorting domain-containing protein [Spirosoma agri]
MKQFYIAILCLLATLSSQGQIITQWNFNAGTTVPSTGSGAVTAIGGTTGAIASGTGSSDPATTADQAYNLDNFPVQGTGSKTAGLDVQVSTVGKQNIKLSFDLRFSTAAANLATVQYSTDGGTTWVDFSTVSAAGGNNWVNSNTVDFSSVTALNNNANARFRIVSTFNSGNTYVPAGGGNYSTVGTYRFDMVTVQGANSAMPVTYYAFNAQYTSSKTVAVTWSTSTEQNNAYFAVERSADLGTFQTIGRIDGKGTSFTQQHYSLTDETPMAGWNYYRLKQVDTDGKTSYSKALAVFNEYSSGVNELILSLNLATHDLSVRLNGNAVLINCIIYTMQGRVVFQSNDVTNPINVSGLPAGIYILEVQTSDNRALRQRFLKL